MNSKPLYNVSVHSQVIHREITSNHQGLGTVGNNNRRQRAKKVVSDSPGLVDFAIGLVNSVLNLPDGQAKIFQRIKITKVL